MMKDQKYLSGKEHDAYMDDLSVVTGEVIDKLIALADKHNVDRDNAVQHFASIFEKMSEITTFKNWGCES